MLRRAIFLIFFFLVIAIDPFFNPNPRIFEENFLCFLFSFIQAKPSHMDMRYSQPPPTGDAVRFRAGNGFLHLKVSPALSSGEIRRFREGENAPRSRHHCDVMASTQVNKAQKTDDDGGGGGGSAPTTLAHVLLILKFLPRKFCHSLVSFTSDHRRHVS